MLPTTTTHPHHLSQVSNRNRFAKHCQEILEALLVVLFVCVVIVSVYLIGSLMVMLMTVGVGSFYTR